MVASEDGLIVVYFFFIGAVCLFVDTTLCFVFIFSKRIFVLNRCCKDRTEGNKRRLVFFSILKVDFAICFIGISCRVFHSLVNDMLWGMIILPSLFLLYRCLGEVAGIEKKRGVFLLNLL